MPASWQQHRNFHLAAAIVCILPYKVHRKESEMNIAERLIEFAKPLCIGQTCQDIRIGLGYICVQLTDGSMGIAWTPNKQHSGSCTHLRQAGSLLNLNALEILSWLNSENMLERALGLATFNAINSKLKRNTVADEAISLLNLKENDYVVMIGHFAPIIPKIREIGCRLEIIDLDSGKLGIINNTKQDLTALADCDVAIITATSIINNTADDLLAALKRNRAAVMLGPSTPLCTEIFKDTRITQLSGAIVIEPERIKTIISEGGGTMLLKKHLQFNSIPV